MQNKQGKKGNLYPRLEQLEVDTYLVETETSIYIAYLEELRPSTFNLVIAESEDYNSGYFCFSSEIYNTIFYDELKSNSSLSKIMSYVEENVVVINNPFQLAVWMGGHIHGKRYTLPKFNKALN